MGVVCVVTQLYVALVCVAFEASRLREVVSFLCVMLLRKELHAKHR